MSFSLTVTSWVAIYGALLSTAGIVWNVYKYKNDKPKMKVKSSVGVLDFGDHLTEALIFEAQNIGKYPVTLSSAGIYFSNNQNMIFCEKEREFPKEILPGKKHLLYRPLYEYVKKIKDTGKPKYLWFKDQTDKEFRGKLISLENFYKEVDNDSKN